MTWFGNLQNKYVVMKYSKLRVFYTPFYLLKRLNHIMNIAIIDIIIAAAPLKSCIYMNIENRYIIFKKT